MSNALELARENHAHRLETALETVRREQHPAAYVMATICHRVLGACALLLDADLSRCRAELARAAAMRLDFLRRGRDQPGLEERYLAASKDMGFACAVAIEDWPLAREIASLSPRAHYPATEYEDNFLFFAFLHGRVLAPGDKAAAAARLARWEAVLEGAASGYWAACKALHDGAGFPAGFEALLEHRARQLDGYAKQVTADREQLAVERGLFVEGLAVAQLARQAGLAAGGPYALVPALALPG